MLKILKKAVDKLLGALILAVLGTVIAVIAEILLLITVLGILLVKSKKTCLVTILMLLCVATAIAVLCDLLSPMIGSLTFAITIIPACIGATILVIIAGVAIGVVLATLFQYLSAGFTHGLSGLWRLRGGWLEHPLVTRFVRRQERENAPLIRQTLITTISARKNASSYKGPVLTSDELDEFEEAIRTEPPQSDNQLLLKRFTCPLSSGSLLNADDPPITIQYKDAQNNFFYYTYNYSLLLQHLQNPAPGAQTMIPKEPTSNILLNNKSITFFMGFPPSVDLEKDLASIQTKIAEYRAAKEKAAADHIESKEEPSTEEMSSVNGAATPPPRPSVPSLEGLRAARAAYFNFSLNDGEGDTSSQARPNRTLSTSSFQE